MQWCGWCLTSGPAGCTRILYRSCHPSSSPQSPTTWRVPAFSSSSSSPSLRPGLMLPSHLSKNLLFVSRASDRGLLQVKRWRRWPDWTSAKCYWICGQSLQTSQQIRSVPVPTGCPQNISKTKQSISFRKWSASSWGALETPWSTQSQITLALRLVSSLSKIYNSLLQIPTNLPKLFLIKFQIS